ncbi:anti-CBASS protein Acb1 family protein [Devosia lacusdianchii]|uniref:anti-CBASS protein Acb1 family protein n=1 Tax=Devosia lacusdianchii TaxID=2917991 RepID=UPI001F059E9F|nr:anti-CBASS Acb1 family protein [Devosia sp. JXJ CY 41]
MNNPLRLVANNATRSLSSMFPGFFPGWFGGAKHNHYADYGFPVVLDFTQLHGTYRRNGIARAAIKKTVAKTWQDNPFLLEKERDGSQGGTTDETTLEEQIRIHFDKLRLWQNLAKADGRSMVGKYAAVILRLADSKKFAEPVDRVPGGLEGLVEIIPAWEGQLTVSQWDDDETSETYGQPKMFQFNEANVATGKANHRAFSVHPDRVVIWSEDGTVHGESALEPGYNDLLTMEKIVGAGGEGFWKNAKSAPVFEIDKDAKLDQMMKAMGAANGEELANKMDEQVEAYQKGFDQMLMVMGMQAKTLGVTLPSPEHFFGITLQSFAASVSMPLKVLVGNQTGERASSEDNEDWALFNMSRRKNIAVPNIMVLVGRLVTFGMLPKKDWFVDWASLVNPGPNEVLERVERMANVNDKMKDTGELVFTPEEMRKETGREPLSPSEAVRDHISDEDEDAAHGLPKPGNEPAGEE